LSFLLMAKRKAGYRPECFVNLLHADA